MLRNRYFVKAIALNESLNLMEIPQGVSKFVMKKGVDNFLVGIMC